MNKEYTNEYPEFTRRHKHKLIELLEEFSKRGEKVMILTPHPDEYASIYSMTSGLGKAIKAGGYPMEVHIIDGKAFVKKLI